MLTVEPTILKCPQAEGESWLPSPEIAFDAGADCHVAPGLGNRAAGRPGARRVREVLAGRQLELASFKRNLQRQHDVDCHRGELRRVLSPVAARRPFKADSGLVVGHGPGGRSAEAKPPRGVDDQVHARDRTE